MKPAIYIETTIPSYLAARPSRDLIRAAHQQLTREWWDTRREQFDLYTSEAVLQECAGGDPDAARRRLTCVDDIPVLMVTEQAQRLAEALLDRVPLPQRAAVDALHIALATISGINYLLTWNCTHIGNATLRPSIESVCRQEGYEPPVICTPEELLEESQDDQRPNR